jgi:hypothetical protein
MWKYNVTLGSWQNLTFFDNTPFYYRTSFGMTVSSSGIIYIFGGNPFTDGVVRKDQMVTYNVLTQTGTLVYREYHPPNVTGISLVIYNDNDVFMFGGDGGDSGYYNDLWDFDITYQNWTLLTMGGDKPSARSFYGMVVYGDSIYLFGGEESDGTELNDLWRYDIIGNVWEEIVPADLAKPPVRSVLTMEVLEGKIYIFGGTYGVFQTLNDIWEYDPVENVWRRLFSTILDTREKRVGFDTVVHDDSVIYLYGGLEIDISSGPYVSSLGDLLLITPGEHCVELNCTGTIPVCIPGCVNGECVEGNVCECCPGYNGTDCSIPICGGKTNADFDVCNGRGICVGPNECNCRRRDYEGPLCNQYIYGDPPNFFCMDTMGVYYHYTSKRACGKYGDCVAPDTCICQCLFFGDVCQFRNETQARIDFCKDFNRQISTTSTLFL